MAVTSVQEYIDSIFSGFSKCCFAHILRSRNIGLLQQLTPKCAAVHQLCFLPSLRNNFSVVNTPTNYPNILLVVSHVGCI